MRSPNGYSSVYKLSGNRRKPWSVRRAIGWEVNESTGHTKQKYQIIEYYKNAAGNIEIAKHKEKEMHYKDVYWLPLMADLSMSHLPHDTRHTTVSLLARANVNPTIFKCIVGYQQKNPRKYIIFEDL